jgi:hypothetical protein
MSEKSISVMIAKRNSGKSTLITDLLYHKRNIPVGVVMSGTEEGNKHYQQFVPDLFVYNEYRSDVLEKMVARQKALIKNNDESHAFIVLDDCMYNKKFMKEDIMRIIFYNGRHWRLFFMLSMQYCMDLSPDLRTNIDYVFILRENIVQNREKIYRNFFGIFPTFDMFNQVMDSCTENYECLVLDNTIKSNKIEDVVFWYKAKVHTKEFKVGHPSLWKLHKEKYDPKYEQKDIQKMKVKYNANKPVVNVKKTIKK